jgi:transposase
MKIVFVLNEGQEKSHAFGATNIKLSAKKILSDYSQRWSIEVFFKNAKQYLNYGKEQVSNFDSIVACDALVLLRYCFLTYLAFKSKSSFYDHVCNLRKQKLTQCFGIQLLMYFLNRLKAVIQHACYLIENQMVDQALNLLKSLADYSPKLAVNCET